MCVDRVNSESKPSQIMTNMHTNVTKAIGMHPHKNTCLHACASRTGMHGAVF